MNSPVAVYETGTLLIARLGKLYTVPVPPNTLTAIPLTSNEAPKSGLRTTKNLLPMWDAPQTIKIGM
jgi:hypothetical protein